jgi:anaerobic selenocysteine-containing dehydrogenase
VAQRTVLGTCHHDCPDSCGWVATVDDDAAGVPVVVKLRGNPAHPYSRGELCPKVSRFVERVYAPDRVLYPMVRDGAKGCGSFRRVSWADALALVRDRVGAVIAEHGGEAVVGWGSAGNQGVLSLSSLDQRFFAHLGATRMTGSLCGATAGAGVKTTFGTARAADPTEVRHAQLVILWGTNTRLTNRHLWPFVEEARASGATVWVIDPVRTITADSADVYVQPLPGTDVALMLAVMHVLVRDDLLDHSYICEHSTGVDELAARVAEWTPERAAEVCGIEASTIEELASAYGATQRSFIRTLIGAEHHEHGAMFFRTLACLPVLTGAWRVQGGGLARSVGSWFSTAVNDDAFAPPASTPVDERPRSLSVNHIGRWLTDPAARVHALFVWNGNPAVSAPNTNAVLEGLSRDDLFCVVSEQFLTDTARHADVVFPATTQLEQLDVVPAWGHLYLGWNEPAIAPLGESVPNTELWRRLAAAFEIDDPFFVLDDEALLRKAFFDNVDLEQLRAVGFQRLAVPEPLLPYTDGGFDASDGRAMLSNRGLPSIGIDAVPDFSPPTIDKSYPFALLSPKTYTRFLNTSYSHHHAEREAEPCAEVDPHDAAALGVAEGTHVRIFNDRGSLVLPAKFTGRVRPGVVAIAWGRWGDTAAVNMLTSDTLADWGGGVAFYSARVALERA